MKPVFESKLHVSDPRCGRLNFTIMMDPRDPIGSQPNDFLSGGHLFGIKFYCSDEDESAKLCCFCNQDAGCSSLKIEKVTSPACEQFNWFKLFSSSYWLLFVERSSIDFFANFHILLRWIFDAHRLINVLWSDLRWTSSPTSTFFFDWSLTRICWEIFVDWSSTDFFANFHILLRSIFDAYLLGNFCGLTFDGLLRQLPYSSSISQSLTRICWEIFVERSSTDFFANFHILLRSIFDAYLLEIFVEWPSMVFIANFHILLRAIFDAHLMRNFCGTTFDGLLRQLPHSSSIDLWRASFDKSFVGLSSIDFFANFHILLRSIFDVHLLIKVLWSDLRWTSSPTSTFFFDRSVTRICWEIFVERSSMVFFANFHILLWSIFCAHRLGNGPLHHHPHSSSINLGRASVGEIFVVWSSMEFSANFYIFLRSIFDAHRLGNFVEWYSDFSGNFNILLRSILDAHLVGKFCGAILDGLLRQLPHSSSINLWRASVGKFSWSDLRWTSSPTSTFLFDQTLTRIR